MTAMDELAEVLRVENAALAAMDWDAATGMVERKRAALERLAAERSAVGAVDPEAAREVDGLATENRDRLRRALDTQREVIGIVAHALRDAEPPRRYAPTGLLAAARAAQPRALSARV